MVNPFLYGDYMILQLSVITDGVNVINKVLNDTLNINVNLKKDFDIENPIIVLTGVKFSDYLDYNYCVIPELNRKYFINESEQINGRMIKLNCSCDVIETYKDDILNSTSRFYRNIKAGDYYDGNLDKSTTKTVTTELSNVTLDDAESMVLVTIKKGK